MTEPGMNVRKRFEKIKAEHGKVIQPEPMIGFLISLVEAAKSDYLYEAGFWDFIEGALKEPRR